ncbi:nicotinamide riboside transporter PnuC [Angustibacter speluncae]
MSGWTMSWTEVAGFVTGALCVWLVVRQQVWNFPVGIANNVFFIVLFVQAGLYADAGLQVVYIGLGVLGWYWWLRGGPARGELAVRRTPRAAWPLLALGCVAAAAVLTWVLTTWTDSTVAVADASTTAMSLTAQLMLNRKWIGSWGVWISVDVLYVGLYAYKGLYLTAVLYLLFIALCVQGRREWRRSLDGARPVDGSAAEALATARP